MNIEVGKFYRTRDGHKVRIYATDGASPYPIHGAILNTNGWSMSMWIADGIHHRGDTSFYDLVAEWIAKPEWPGVAVWHNWVARDKDGRWFAYVDRPDIRGSERWMPNGDYDSIPPAYAPKWTGDWRESLIERPTK